MITAQEKGRRLHITVGEGEGSEAFVIEPVDVETGAALLVQFLGVMSTDAGDDPEQAAALAATAGESMTTLTKLAIGEANYRRVQGLRPQEAKDVVYAAYFWNTQGGGTEALDAYLSDGLGKAISAVFAAAGLLTKQPSMI